MEHLVPRGAPHSSSSGVWQVIAYMLRLEDLFSNQHRNHRTRFCFETNDTNGMVTLLATLKPVAAPPITIDQATQALGISRSTLWRRLRSGTIQSVRRGGRRLVQLPAGHKAGANVTSEIPPFTEDHPAPSSRYWMPMTPTTDAQCKWPARLLWRGDRASSLTTSR